MTLYNNILFTNLVNERMHELSGYFCCWKDCCYKKTGKRTHWCAQSLGMQSGPARQLVGSLNSTRFSCFCWVRVTIKGTIEWGE